MAVSTISKGGAMIMLKYGAGPNDTNRPSNAGCCAGTQTVRSMQEAKTTIKLKLTKKKPPEWTIGSLSTPAGDIYKIPTDWTFSDYIGMIRSRVSAYRMNYTIPPGIYAVGAPDKDSDVFVTSNYKLSFDMLRRSLKGIDAWVLALDTKGINVWCAAGKGTFGDAELIRRMNESQLSKIVAHRRIILPQLSAPGVNAGLVQKETGFRVYFGPVLAKDILEYIKAGYKKTGRMSSVPFSMTDRLILTPMEINPAMRKFPWFAAAVLFIFGLEPSGIIFERAWNDGYPFLMLGFASILSGSLMTPLLLPFIPFRSFAIKGLIVGLAVVLICMRYIDGNIDGNPLLLASSLLLFPAISSYLALQFTGATTFTGISGVKKEVRISIPFHIGAAVASIILVIIHKIREWGVQ